MDGHSPGVRVARSALDDPGPASQHSRRIHLTSRRVTLSRSRTAPVKGLASGCPGPKGGPHLSNWPQAQLRQLRPHQTAQSPVALSLGFFRLPQPGGHKLNHLPQAR